MPDRLTPLEKLNTEVRHADGSNLPLVHQSHHSCPGVFHRRACLVRPVDLVQVDSLDAEAAERGLTLGTNRLGSEDLPWRGGSITLVPHHSAFGEDIGPV